MAPWGPEVGAVFNQADAAPACDGPDLWAHLVIHA